MSNQKGRISLRGVRKVFGNFEALKSIDLEIEPVEFFASGHQDQARARLCG